MARVLLAWELGGNRGHVAKLGQLARALRDLGHEPVFALQRVDMIRLLPEDLRSSPVRQAPVWPGLLRLSQDILPLPAQVSYGDCLAAVGLSDSGILAGLIRAWDGVFADLAPQALVADFAPAALLAAAGRMPRLAIGTGFTVPPAHLAGFGSLVAGREPVVAQAALLPLVNRALAQTGRAGLPDLGALARAEIMAPMVFAPLDPYFGQRAEPVWPPFAPFETAPTAAAPHGIYSYLHRATPEILHAISTLCRSGHRVFGAVSGLSSAQSAQLAAAGMAFCAPLSPEAIAERAALVLCNGGAGLVGQMAARGVALALFPYDLEKRLTAQALTPLGGGVCFDLKALPADLSERLAGLAAAPLGGDLGGRLRAELRFDPGLRGAELLGGLV